MAIEISLRDGIDPAIQSKMESLAGVAKRLEDQVKSLQKSLGHLNAGGLNSAGAAIQARMGGGSSSNRGRRSYESAFVTAQKQQQKTRDEIAKVFNDGFAAQEKQRAATEKAFDRSTRAAERAANRQAARLAKVESANVTAARQLQAKRDEITKVFEQGLAARAAATVSTTPQLAAPKNMRNYIDQTIANSTPSSLVVRKQQQQLYDGIFGAHNLTTSASQQWSATLSNIVARAKPSSAATRAASQSMYDNLFSAVPAQPKVPQVQVASIAPNVLKAAAAQNVWTQSANNTATAMQRLDHSVSFLRSDGLRWAKVLWALGGATLTAGAIVAAADAYTRLQNRLSVVAETQQHVNGLTQEMLRISTASRQPIEETAKTFTRFDLAMQQAGRTQADTISLTENVAKALKLGGATAGEAASALLQLSQAFNKGKLDGDEFRSMMENSPILADELAKSLKVTRGELLKLAPQGKITAKVMADAWIGATDRINEAFEKLKPTIAESFTVLRSNAVVFFGQLDSQLGITAAMSEMIIALAGNLDVLTFAFLALAPVIAVFVGTQLISGLGAMIAYMGRTAAAVAAIRSPITIVVGGLMNMARQGAVTGATLVAAFSSATTRAVALQMGVIRATAGVLALGAAARTAGAALLAAFSFGNIIMIIGVAVAAAIAFGDAMIVNAEKGTTMRDYTIAAFSVMADYVERAFNDTFDYINDGFDKTGLKAESTGSRVLFSLGALADGTASLADGVMTLINWVGHLIAAVATGILQTAQNVVKTIYNIVLPVTNVITETINLALRGLAELSSFAGRIGNLFGGGYDTNVIAPQIEQSKMLAIGYGETAEAFAKLNNQQEIGVDIAQRSLATYRADVKAKAEAIAKARAAELKNTPRTPAAQAAADGAKNKKPKKTDEEKRADIIAKVMNAEESAIRVSQRLGDERERLNVIEELNNKLKEKGYAQLSLGANGERELIGRLVQQRIVAERVGEAMEEMYQRAEKPMIDYGAKYKALDNLLARGVLNNNQYAASIRGISAELAAATDPLNTLVLELEKLKMLQGATGDARQIAGSNIDARRDADSKGMPFDGERASALQQQILDYQRAAAAAEDITSRTKTAIIENNYALTAQHEAYRAGAISVGMYTRELSTLMATQGQLFENTFGLNNADPFEPMRRGLYQLVGEMPTLGQAMSDAISSTLGNAIDNISSTLSDMILNFDAYAEGVAEALDRPVSTLEVMRYALADIINQIGKELINAVIKMGVQWAITRAAQAVADKAAIATTTAAQVGSMTAIGAAAAPTAMATSVATAGGAAAAGMSGMTMAMLAVGGIMALAMGAGKFQDGGILGGMGTGRSDSTLFWGSRGEMIMNRDAVSANQPMLEAMNNGATAGGGSYVDNSVHVTVYYNKDGSTTQDGEGNEFTQDMVRFIDSRVNKGITASQKQGKGGYR